jgi:hypothetical protein
MVIKVGQEISGGYFKELQGSNALREFVSDVAQCFNMEEVSLVAHDSKAYFVSVLILRQEFHEVFVIKVILLIVI